MFCKDDWKQWGISVIGKSHIENDLPNQDAFMVNFKGKSDRKVLYAVVADGLGSKSRSDEGARTLCKVVKKVSKFFKQYPETTPSDMVMYIQGMWTCELMKLNPTKISDFSTTAIFVFLYKDKLLVCQLGDGLICGVFDDEGKNFKLLDDDKDGFANITTSLGPLMKLRDWKVGLTDSKGLKTLMLCTDGISTDIENNEYSFAKSLADEYRNTKISECLSDAQRWISEWPVKGNFDDKTLVLITRLTKNGR